MINKTMMIIIIIMVVVVVGRQFLFADEWENAWEENGWSQGKAEWTTGGHGSFQGEAWGPETEVEGSAKLFNKEGTISNEGGEEWSNINVFSSQEAGAEISSFGEESEGKIQGAAEQESNFNHYRENEWNSGATEAFSSAGQYGQAGFFGDGGGDGNTQISGSGKMAGTLTGYIENSKIEEENMYGYFSKAGSLAENTGNSQISFEGESTEDAYAYTEGVGSANAGTFASGQFGDKIEAMASSYGEAQFEYYVEAGFSGDAGIEANSIGQAKAQTDGTSKVWKEGNSIYSEAWQKSTSTTNSPTYSTGKGVVGGITGNDSSTQE